MTNLDVRDTVLMRRMPSSLQRRGQTVAGTAVDVPGPTALEARSFALDIERVIGSSLLLLADTLQEPYALWHVERDRDLIHKTLHLGAGVYAATSALTTRDDERSGGTTIEAVRWVHAAYALAAETHYVEELIAELAHLVDLAKLEKKVTRQLEDARRYLERVTQDEDVTGSSRDRILDDYRSRLARAEARRDLIDHVLRAAHSRDDLAVSAARLLFGTLEQYHRVIAPLARDAFQHTCVRHWIDAYRDAVRRGEQESVEFADYPVPTGDRLPRHVRLTIDDIDAALDGNPGPLIAPHLEADRS
ncbi:hypothetical protein [Curtobacterium sp. UCD-KPL2560]|uniref:hypothetical protein n=1 Tax=Curtobacterium sp. UCD-KPL2560 TaxID=1885315 RepID=UPI000824B81D|nr:hypothetical protein [Curtobacterium sp. UCD-KPL2560]